MKSYAFILARTAAVILCAHVGTANAKESVYTTAFPEGTSHQVDMRAMAGVAYPVNSSLSRIWLKGSNDLPSAKIHARDGRVLDSVELSPPFYTSVVSVPNVENVNVVFSNSTHEDVKKVEVMLRPVNSEYMEKDDGAPYSVAFYGCFQPFTVRSTKSGLRASIFNGNAKDSGFSPKFLRLFNKTVLGETKYPRSRLVVGTGDQVYVDAGYEAVEAVDRSHPISAWTNDGRPLKDEPGEYAMHLDDMYRAFFSFKDMREIFSSTPQVSAWDDHEIRDGWGSVGDEYIGNEINPKLLPYFKNARQAYIDHQFKFGGENDPGESLATALTQEFRVGRLSGFILDLRSHRNVNASRVVDEQQISDFSDWLNRNRGRQVVIISSMPFFLVNKPFIEEHAYGNIVDDVRDSWSASINRDQRELLLQKVIESDVKPIFVSGDYHKAALSEIWKIDSSGKKTVFAYELLATGIYHEGLITSSAPRFGFSRIEAQRSAEHYITVNTSGGDIKLEPYVRRSLVANNFGLVTVNNSDVTIRMFAADESNSDSVAEVYSLQGRWGTDFDEKDNLTSHWWSNFVNIFLPEKSEYINVKWPVVENIDLPVDFPGGSELSGS